MKIILATLAAAGLGWLGLFSGGPTDEACLPGDCEVQMECLPDGTCRLECTGPDGKSCWMVIDCKGDGDCRILESGGSACDVAERALDCSPAQDCKTAQGCKLAK